VYRLFRNSVHLIDGQGGSLEMQTRSMTEEDALLVISFAPYSREVLQVVEAGKRAGCKVIAITDSDASPLSLLADATLLFSTQSPSFFPSITSGMALTESLLELLVSRAGQPVIDRIESGGTPFRVRRLCGCCQERPLALPRRRARLSQRDAARPSISNDAAARRCIGKAGTAASRRRRASDAARTGRYGGC
jgi:hypothetical protein